jgi:regulatory protein
MRTEREAGRLSPGSRNELVHRMGEIAQGCASLRVRGLVERRDYSSKEIADKLGLDGYARPVIEVAVTRAVESRLVDDARYADVFIRSRVGQGWGSLKIERELGRRGISVESVAGWPESFFSDVCEEDVAYELARGRHLTGKNDYGKIVRFLYGRGYSGSVSSRVARRLLDEMASDS